MTTWHDITGWMIRRSHVLSEEEKRRQLEQLRQMFEMENKQAACDADKEGH